jgi:hypothetical protein
MTQDPVRLESTDVVQGAKATHRCYRVIKNG